MEAVAKHDFTANASDELSFRKNQILKVYRRRASGRSPEPEERRGRLPFDNCQSSGRPAPRPSALPHRTLVTRSYPDPPF